MSKQEMQIRLDEASKVISPDNAKRLPQEVQERTGLETNPLWHLECLIRSGTLTPQQTVAACKTLAEFTHSKAPTMSQHVTATLKAEDFLAQLAAEQYPPVAVEARTRAPVGQGKHSAKRAKQYAAQKAAKAQIVIDVTPEPDDRS